MLLSHGYSGYPCSSAAITAGPAVQVSQLDDDVADGVPVVCSSTRRYLSVTAPPMFFPVSSASTVAPIAITFGVATDVALDSAPSSVTLVNLPQILRLERSRLSLRLLMALLLLRVVMSRLSPRLLPSRLHCHHLFYHFRISRRRLSLFLRLFSCPLVLLLLQSLLGSLHDLFVVAWLVTTANIWTLPIALLLGRFTSNV